MAFMPGDGVREESRTPDWGGPARGLRAFRSSLTLHFTTLPPASATPFPQAARLRGAVGPVVGEGRPAGSQVPLQQPPAGRVERLDVGDEVANPAGVRDQRPPLAQEVDVVAAL